MTHVKCEDGKEIDVLAVDLLNEKKYHIESGLSTAFESRMKGSEKTHKVPCESRIASFIEEKFEDSAVTTRIKQFFGGEDYERVFVLPASGHNKDSLVQRTLQLHGIHALLARDIIADLKKDFHVTRSRDVVARLMDLIEGESEESDKQMGLLFDKKTKTSTNELNISKSRCFFKDCQRYNPNACTRKREKKCIEAQRRWRILEQL